MTVKKIALIVSFIDFLLEENNHILLLLLIYNFSIYYLLQIILLCHIYYMQKSLRSVTAVNNFIVASAANFYDNVFCLVLPRRFILPRASLELYKRCMRQRRHCRNPLAKEVIYDRENDERILINSVHVGLNKEKEIKRSKKKIEKNA